MDSIIDACTTCVYEVLRAPAWVLLSASLSCAIGFFVFIYVFFSFVAPHPRPPIASEKQYTTVLKDGSISQPLPLPCWQDESVRSTKRRRMVSDKALHLDIDQPSLYMSVVIPAYNEQDRIPTMLEEAVDYLQEQYSARSDKSRSSVTAEGSPKPRSTANGNASHLTAPDADVSGWEIIVVSDGSTDKTVEIVQKFTKSRVLAQNPTQTFNETSSIPPDTIRVVKLVRNRGKGGAVTHGLRHVRGKYVIFADADGASKFSDLGSLVSAAGRVSDQDDRVVVVGSRAHLVGTEATVQRSALRNFLMYSFHTLLSLLTPPQTARIKDTQCGFKLFSRSSLPHIVPYMHSEGWIFDVEMLMLAEGAGIKVEEVAVGWKEVGGSKLNVVRDSIGMAWGLAVLRVCWGMGIYSRNVLPDEAVTSLTNGGPPGSSKKIN